MTDQQIQIYRGLTALKSWVSKFKLLNFWGFARPNKQTTEIWIGCLAFIATFDNFSPTDS